MRPTRRRVSWRAKTSRFGIAVSMVNVRRAVRSASSDDDPPDENAARKSDNVEKTRALSHSFSYIPHTSAMNYAP